MATKNNKNDIENKKWMHNKFVKYQMKTNQNSA